MPSRDRWLPIRFGCLDAPRVLSKEALTTGAIEPGYFRLHDLPLFAVDPRSSACSAFSRLKAAAAYTASS
jgi:hypothetical protein